MGKLTVYNFISLNGYYKGANEDISWAKQSETQAEKDFAAENLSGNATLLFGRKTYDMMASYWPTPQAMQQSPNVAEGMNRAEKIVFSKSLKKAGWNNTRIATDMDTEIKKLKKGGKDCTILGSGTLVSQLAGKGLIDELQLMIYPVVLNNGTPLMKDIKENVELVLVNTQSFKSGVVLLTYKLQVRSRK